MVPHRHNFLPLTRWVGRYRCETCGCLGYRERLTTGFGSEEIIPYLCNHPGCEKCATHGENGVYWCGTHRAKLKPVEVACDYCQAKATYMCRDKKGQRLLNFHPERKKLARQGGVREED